MAEYNTKYNPGHTPNRYLPCESPPKTPKILDETDPLDLKNVQPITNTEPLQKQKHKILGQNPVLVEKRKKIVVQKKVAPKNTRETNSFEDPFGSYSPKTEQTDSHDISEIRENLEVKKGEEEKFFLP